MADDARLTPVPVALRAAFAAALGALLLVTAHSAGAQALLAERVEGDCVLRLESHPEWHTARIRVRTSAGARCDGQIDAVIALLDDGLALADIRYTSIAFGRTVDFGWLRSALRNLAASDPGWDAASGRPVSGEVNAHVAALIEDGAVFEPLQPVLARHGYTLRGVSLEKVLVAEDGLPFDAQLWLLLAPR